AARRARPTRAARLHPGTCGEGDGVMIAFVTGATGFLGRRLTAALLAEGYEVTALVRPDRDRPHGLPESVRRVYGDTCDPAALRQADGCDILFHLPGVYRLGETDPRTMEEVNVAGTRHVLEAAAAGRVGRVVVVSSQVALGPSGEGPVTEESEHDHRFRSKYERTKWLAHLAAVEAGRQGAPGRIALPRGVYRPEDPSPLGDTLRRFAPRTLP